MMKPAAIQLLLLCCLATACLSLKECIDPIRASTKDELTCSSEFSLVSRKICHYNDPDCLPPATSEGSDVCAFVTESIFADWKMLHAAFFTAGSCKASIEEGRFTPEDALRVLPDNNEIVGARVLGRDLILALENQLVDYFVHGKKEAYPHTAGLKYKLDLLQPTGQKIRDIKLLGNTCKWKPLNENESYMIVTNGVIAESIFSGKTLEQSHTKKGETEMLWTHTSSVCFLKDNWHQMRLKHNPSKIPLEPLEDVKTTKRNVVFSE